MALATGTSAPDFTLKTKTADGLADITLSANFGSKKTVLLFFPLAFTSVCTDELCTMSSALEEYAALDAVVYGLSVDSPFAQEAFAKANAITVPLLSDFNKEVAAAYDVLYEDLLGFKGVSKRAAFVIDTDGKVAYSWVTEDPHNLPPFDEVKAALS
ncbi:redoxin domain-containing protein [Cerasicoccus maritimus]|uniref:redoxin domain-containing protein n=1 Tax=Cerasicoccus maritimus TaxID=490089 RepID=UPI002852B9F0|nr:redoxin domain-containing protein [Cerasicoccus maritimus]